jgi:hypothetical protein
MQNKIKVFILILLILTAFVTNYNFADNVEPPKVNIKDRIPLSILDYTGTEEEIPEKVFNIIKPEEISIRSYKKADGDNEKQINLALVVSEDKENLHAPEVCYKLQGFEFKKETGFRLSECCKVTRVDTIRQDKPYIFHFYYTDMERVYTTRTEFMTNIMINKVLNKPRKKYALVLAFTEDSNEDDLKDFSKAVNDLILKADNQGN